MQNKDETREVPADLEGQRLDQALALLAPQMGLRGRKRLFEHYLVLVDGRPRPKGYRVQAGQVLSLRLREDAASEAPDGVPDGVRVAGQSTGRYAALVKPAGLHTEAVAGSPEPSLEALLPGFFPGRFATLLNRLDRDTSGLVLVALSPEAESAYRSQEAGLSVVKSYLALARGSVWAEARLDAALDTADRVRVKVLPAADPDPARHTLVTPLLYNDELSATLVRATIHRGARHQIRAHLAAAGHPLVGDTVYGPIPDDRQGGLLYLHHFCINLTTLDFASKAWPTWPQWEEWSQGLDLDALVS